MQDRTRSTQVSVARRTRPLSGLIVAMAILPTALFAQEPPRVARVPETRSLDAAAASVATRLYTLRKPCRLIDTRDPGQGALGAGTLRGVSALPCQVSPTASALSVNVTATAATTGGYLTVFASGAATPNVATVNYSANQTRANNATVGVGGGAIAIYAGQASGAVHAIIDASAYWDSPANNQPPSVDAGADQLVTLPNSGVLSGFVSDDGKPNASPTISWSKVKGPGTPTFTSPNAASTSVSFDLPGTYVLRLTAFDGALTSADDVTVNVNPSLGDLVRFLEQSTFGTSPALISHVQQIGVGAFLTEQFSLPSTGWPYIGPTPSNVPATCNSVCQRDAYSMYQLQNRLYLNAMYGNDQLRQRVIWALHQLFVVSGRDINVANWYLQYILTLDRNAFGNYRQLLYEITLNPAMGKYLDMATSTKNNPNENYAREILQLFSIGTELLNPDGTSILDINGDPLPSYDQTTVTNFAKVFTGWQLAPNVAPGTPDYTTPMVANATNHDTTSKTLLNGLVTTAGQTALQDLNTALDNIFNHQNTAPFIARHFIHQLVTSNPSPAYIGRVAAVFANNGAGVRGDLAAVVQAVLLDPEARGAVQYDPNYGHLREPVLFLCNLLRAFNPRSANLSTGSDGVVNGQAVAMGQDAWRPPTVFSYYPADYLLPGSTTVLAPEFGVLQATTALKRANFVNTMVFSSIPVGTNVPNGTAIDISVLVSLAGNATTLVDYLNQVLMHGAMSTTMQNDVIAAVNAVAATNPTLRAQQALYLVATSSQYQVEQ